MSSDDPHPIPTAQHDRGSEPIVSGLASTNDQAHLTPNSPVKSLGLDATKPTVPPASLPTATPTTVSGIDSLSLRRARQRKELALLNLGQPALSSATPICLTDPSLDQLTDEEARSERKRPFDTSTPAELRHNSGSSQKRLRIHRRSRHILDPFNFPFDSTVDAGPPASPLFFSNSPQPRPRLPPRFSSSEAAARMLSKTQGEDVSMKTVTLPRGTPSTSSPPARPHLRSRNSNERYLSGTNRIESPGLIEDGDTLHMLGNIGITELLEQDERPTFIVDLGDAANFTASALRIVFANLALRSIAGLLGTVAGTIESPSVSQTFPAFKAWLLGAAANGESLDVCLPSFLQGPFSWSCSTLRKRYRIAAATLVVLPPPTPLGAPHADDARTSPRTVGPRPERRNHVLSAANTPCREPQDYFGNATTVIAALPSQSILPSIEPIETSSPAVKHIDHSTNSDPSQACSTSRLTNGSMELVPPRSVNEVAKYARRVSENEVGFFDWTRLPNSAELPQHIRFARSVDWEATALGSIAVGLPTFARCVI